MPFGFIKLPVSLCRERFLEYEDAPYVMSEDEAGAEAEARMNALIAGETAAVEILSRETKKGFDGERYTVECVLACLEDIAVEKIS